MTETLAPRPRQDFCPSCGEILPVLTELHTKLHQQADEIEEKEGHLRDLEAALRIERAKVSRYRGEQVEQRNASPFYDSAVEVYEHWRRKCMPRAREFSDERFEKVVARLRAGFTVAELKHSIDGYSRKPYVVRGTRTEQGRPDQKYVDLGLICRDEKHVLTGVAIADMYEIVALVAEDHLSRADVRRMQHRMTDAVIERLGELRGWTAQAIRKLGLGIDGNRVTFPMGNAEGTITGLCRYQPNPALRGDQPKLIASGSRELFPAPETVEASLLWLVEGEPDAVAMWSMGHPAVAVPGVAKWDRSWAERFEKFDRVLVCFDCDDPGRRAADARVKDLAGITRCQAIDLGGTDGYDVGDVLIERGAEAASFLTAKVVKTGGDVRPMKRPSDGRRPIERVIAALERAGCTVRGQEPQMTSHCPNHDDRQPSMSLAVGDDDRVLLTCHAGCTSDEIIAALNLEWRELFAA